MHSRTRFAVRLRLRLPVLLAGVLLVAPMAGASAYNQDPYTSSNNTTQAKNCWCAVATALTLVKYIPNSTIATQTNVDAYMRLHDKYNWPAIGGQTCADGSVGHDPRGLAYAVWNYTPAGYGFNDYGKTSQSTQDWQIVYGIRATNKPVAASVAYGKHVVTVIGYNTLYDPTVDVPNTINGFYVLDPWYPHSYSSGLPPAGAYDGLPSDPNYGIAPNTYFTLSTWNSTYFLKDTNEGAYWNNQYVLVLRASTSAAPSNTPAATYGDWWFATNYPRGASVTSADTAPSAIAAATQLDPTPTTSSSISAAVKSGLEEHGLTKGGSLGLDLTGYTVGASVHVDSLAKDIPSYDLAEIRVRGEIRAVAMVSETPQGYQFAALTPADGDFQLATAQGRDRLLAAHGMTGAGRLVWAWTKDDLGSVFSPFIEGTDAASGAHVYLTIRGQRSTIELVAGETPATK